MNSSNLTGPTQVAIPDDFRNIPDIQGAIDCASSMVPLCHHLCSGDIAPIASLVYGKIAVCKFFPEKEGHICMPAARERYMVR
jgi:hypothetical protein